MIHTRLLAAFVFAVISISAVSATAQEKKKPAAKKPMDDQAAMQMMMKLATPGEGHKKLEGLLGTWQTKMNMWMAPGKPPMVSEGTSDHKWALGGRFMEQRFEGTFMNQPFSGIGYTGFDNYKKKYVEVWMDTAGTAILQATGSFDAAGKVLTSSGKVDDFTTGKVATMRSKLAIVSQSELLMEMWGPAPDGKEYRMMEIRYTRKK